MQNFDFPSSYQHLHTQLPDTTSIDLYLDKAGLYDHIPRGIAVISVKGKTQLCTLRGKILGNLVNLEVISPQNESIYRLDAIKHEISLKGELIEVSSELKHAVFFEESKNQPGLSAPLQGSPDPVPVNVRYDVQSSGGNFVFKDFTIIPWPIGSWKGSTLWETDSGLVFLAPDLIGDQMIFRMTSFGLQTVGTLRCRRSELINEKTAEIIGDSTVWLNNQWTHVTGRIWQY